MKAVIDRIENGIAVLLVGQEEKRVDIPLTRLPEGASEGSWLRVSFPDEDLDGLWKNAAFELDREGEDQQRKKISNLLERLKNKPGKA
ncbi:MAG TPA: DUF3006 domain-containing protein [Bacillota bacterium]|nr:DUF3006 domain-containing protein [Bacillota bacterium]